MAATDPFTSLPMPAAWHSRQPLVKARCVAAPGHRIPNTEMIKVRLPEMLAWITLPIQGDFIQTIYYLDWCNQIIFSDGSVLEFFQKYKTFTGSLELHHELKRKNVCNLSCTLHFQSEQLLYPSFLAFKLICSQNWFSITDRPVTRGLCSFLYPNKHRFDVWALAVYL